MSDDKHECPFEVGQWVTDGDRVGKVDYDKMGWGIGWHIVILDCGTHTISRPDWSRWTAFGPADIANAATEMWGESPLRHVLPWAKRTNELHARAEAAEARVKELEADLRRTQGLVSNYKRCAREMEPPPGHVLVSLPREDVEKMVNAGTRETRTEIRRRGQRLDEACRKALEADDA